MDSLLQDIIRNNVLALMMSDRLVKLAKSAPPVLGETYRLFVHAQVSFTCQRFLDKTYFGLVCVSFFISDLIKLHAKQTRHETREQASLSEL